MDEADGVKTCRRNRRPSRSRRRERALRIRMGRRKGIRLGKLNLRSMISRLASRCPPFHEPRVGMTTGTGLKFQGTGQPVSGKLQAQPIRSFLSHCGMSLRQLAVDRKRETNTGCSRPRPSDHEKAGSSTSVALQSRQTIPTLPFRYTDVTGDQSGFRFK